MKQLSFVDVLIGMTIMSLVVLAMIGIGANKSANAATPSTANIEWEMGISGYIIANPTTATFLTVPGPANHATFTVTGGPLCVSKGTHVPTASNSERWPEGATLKEMNDGPMLKRMRVINCDDGDPATVQVYFSRKWRSGDSQ